MENEATTMEAAMVREIVDVIPGLSDWNIAVIGVSIQNELDRRLAKQKLENEPEPKTKIKTLTRIK